MVSAARGIIHRWKRMSDDMDYMYAVVRLNDTISSWMKSNDVSTEEYGIGFIIYGFSNLYEK